MTSVSRILSGWSIASLMYPMVLSRINLSALSVSVIILTVTNWKPARCLSSILIDHSMRKSRGGRMPLPVKGLGYFVRRSEASRTRNLIKLLFWLSWLSSCLASWLYLVNGLIVAFLTSFIGACAMSSITHKEIIPQAGVRSLIRG